MNRRDFMKLSAASAVTMGAVAGMAPASFAENAGVHTDAEVQAMVAEELCLSREVAFYPAAFRGDFDKFYVLFHKLSRAQYEKVDGAPAPGINASHYEMCVALTNARKALRKIKDPKSTVWEIWGDQMAVESPLPTNWENCYDNEGFRPFLNPYLLRDQGKVKGNVIIIAGGGSTHQPKDGDFIWDLSFNFGPTDFPDGSTGKGTFIQCRDFYGTLRVFTSIDGKTLRCTTSEQEAFLQQVYDIVSLEP